MITIARIDDGQRAKLVCEECGAETYVRLIGETPKTTVEQAVKSLNAAADGHRAQCPRT